MEPEDEKNAETITGFAVWDASAPTEVHSQEAVVFAAAQYIAKIYALPEDVIEQHTVDGAAGPATVKALQAKLKPWAYFDGTTHPSAWSIDPGPIAPTEEGCYCVCFDCFPNQVRRLSDEQFEPYLRNFWQALLTDNDHDMGRSLKELSKMGGGFALVQAEYSLGTLTLTYSRNGKEPRTMWLSKPYEAGPDYSMKAKLLRRRIPGMAAQVDCPVVAKTFYEMDCNVCNLDIMNLVIHLNDNHRWTREQIADHLELLELEGIDLTVQDPPGRPYIAERITFDSAAMFANAPEFPSPEG